jgi:hypothetical protein
MSRISITSLIAKSLSHHLQEGGGEGEEERRSMSASSNDLDTDSCASLDELRHQFTSKSSSGKKQKFDWVKFYE